MEARKEKRIFICRDAFLCESLLNVSNKETRPGANHFFITESFLAGALIKESVATGVVGSVDGLPDKF